MSNDDKQSQPAQPEERPPGRGSQKDYCSVGGTHSFASHMRGGFTLAIPRCYLCGWIDFDDIERQINQEIRSAISDMAAQLMFGSTRMPDANIHWPSPLFKEKVADWIVRCAERFE